MIKILSHIFALKWQLNAYFSNNFLTRIAQGEHKECLSFCKIFDSIFLETRLIFRMLFMIYEGWFDHIFSITLSSESKPVDMYVFLVLSNDPFCFAWSFLTIFLKILYETNFTDSYLYIFFKFRFQMQLFLFWVSASKMSTKL